MRFWLGVALGLFVAFAAAAVAQERLASVRTSMIELVDASGEVRARIRLDENGRGVLEGFVNASEAPASEERGDALARVGEAIRERIPFTSLDAALRRRFIDAAEWERRDFLLLDQLINVEAALQRGLPEKSREIGRRIDAIAKALEYGDVASATEKLREEFDR